MNLQPFLSQHALSDQRWLQLQNAHLFITGGSGLFGRWLLSALLDANQRLGSNIQVTVLSRNPAPLQAEFNTQAGAEALHFWPGDVTDFEFSSTKFTHIIHMATTSAHETFAGEGSLAKFHMLTKGTERVLQLAAHSGVKKVLFTSSGVAYGAYPQGHVPENYQGAPSPLDAVSGLAQGKRAAEFLCSYYADKHGFEATIARCFSFVGPGLPFDIHYAIGNFIRDALHSENITVKGDGTPMRSFLYLGDLVHWLLALLVDGQNNKIYNVGSDKEISILELANTVKSQIAPQKQVVVLGDTQHAVGNINRNWYVPDISLARRELQLDNWTPLDAAISHTAQSMAGMI